MSQENVEIVKEIFALFDRGDAEGGRALLSPAVEWDTTRFPFPDLSGVYRGPDSVRDWWLRWLEPWESYVVKPEEFIEAGDEVVVPTRGHARGRDGIEVEVHFTGIYTIRGQRVARYRHFQTKAEALEAAGLRE